jgi:glyoxylase-like metal-dependent hydrolase (beta-lactamase superfamily II)
MMFSTRLDSHIFLIDLQPAGFCHFIASYVLKADSVAIVESGPTVTVPNVLAGLQEIGVDDEDVDYVAVSHIHLDHGGGAGLLLSHLPNARLIVHRRGASHIASPGKLWAQARQVLGKVAELYEEPLPVSSKRIIVAEDGMTFDLGEGVEITVVETLGHASHHQSFYEKKSGGIFPGDAAGIYIPEHDVIIPTTPAPFHLETTLASIEKLKQLKPKLLYYSHFGRAAKASERLQSHADQLRLWAEIVAEKMKEVATVEEMQQEIEKRDLATRKVSDYIKSHPILNRGVISQNIQGFIEYFRNLEKQGSRQT